MNSISLFVCKDIVLEVRAAAMFRCSFAENTMWAASKSCLCSVTVMRTLCLKHVEDTVSDRSGAMTAGLAVCEI